MHHRTERDGAPDNSVENLAGIVVLGGSMSATSDANFPTRTAELRLLDQALSKNVPVLGICLGAQLLALAGGGRVYRSGPLEIGWHPVHVASEKVRADPLFADVPRTFTPLHWHGETSDPPPGAVVLASSATYANQAFRLGTNAWGLQFHPEVDTAAVRSFVRAFPDEAPHASGGAAAMLNCADRQVAALAPIRDRLLGGFARVVHQRAEVLGDSAGGPDLGHHTEGIDQGLGILEVGQNRVG